MIDMTTRPQQRYTIATANPDGSETISPMKAWLRQHPDIVPVDPSTKDLPNSHVIRRLLRKKEGWSSQETPDEFRLYPPGSTPHDPDDGDDAAADDGSGYGSFRLEAELRDFLANNLGLVRIVSSSLRLVGVERQTATGPIDILATDEAGAFYVFELKRAATPDKAIGQVTRYMGWVMENLAKAKPVYGVVVAREITENLKYAVLAIPHVSLFEYQITFALKPVARAAAA